jgi:hypothetical protein
MHDDRSLELRTSNQPTSSPDTIFGEPVEPWMIQLANHLSKREAEMPYRRRLRSYLDALDAAELAKRRPA